MAVPTTDSLLVPYTENAYDRLFSSPATYFVSAAKVAELLPLKLAYVTNVQNMLVARADGTRSTAQTAGTRSSRQAVLDYLRPLYASVQANPEIADSNKLLLGVKPRKTLATPVPPINVDPTVVIDGVEGFTVTARVYDPTSATKRRKYPSATGAYVYVYVGATAPTDPKLWRFFGQATAGTIRIGFPTDTPAGSKVWVCASWVSRRGMTGPASNPVSTNIQGGTMGAASEMKLAA